MILNNLLDALWFNNYILKEIMLCVCFFVLFYIFANLNIYIY